MLLSLALTLALLPQAADADARFEQCVDAVAADAKAGETAAGKWRNEGGGYRARACLGLAYANQSRWLPAAGALEQAAREAELAHDKAAADYWAKAGNAWLAAGDTAKARAALDAAIAAGSLDGLGLGEAYLDRGRARVADGDLGGAREDLDRALADAATDPLAWLLSATLARRAHDLPRARTDIANALRLSPDDASVQLEAGNIAGIGGDEPGARSAFARVIELAPGSPQAQSARTALEQFGPEQ